jgi:hypothetical protein
VTAPTAPARRDEDTTPPLPWRRMAWVTWRQHRIALAGVAALLGAVALYLWLAGTSLHRAYAVAIACHPASSVGCQNMRFEFDNSYGPTGQTIASLLLALPVLTGAFAGAPVLARELETGTFRFAWTLAFGRWRWTLAKLVPLAIAVTAAAGLFSLLFSWFFQPFLADGSQLPLDPKLFSLRGVAFAAWTLTAFAIGTLAGMLIRRVVAAIAATMAVYAGLFLAARLYLQQHYLAPVVASGINVPGDAWVMSQWWVKGGVTYSPSAMDQIVTPVFQRIMSAVPSSVPRDDVKVYKHSAVLNVQQYLVRHGYTQWTTYQPGSRFWTFQWIEGGWLLALSVLLIAGTVWLVRHRAG